MSFEIEGRVEQVGGNPMSGVCVSNGQAVVCTDQEGRYRLAIDPDAHRFIFVSTPTGYQPSGPSFLSTAGWDGPRQEVDFALQRTQMRHRPSFVFVHATDIHVNDAAGGDRFASELKRLIATTDPAFVLISGDVTSRGTHMQLQAYRTAIESAAVPVFTLFGGHDGNEERRDENVEPPYTRHFEKYLGPIYFSLDWGGWHFVFWPNEDQFFTARDVLNKQQWLQQDLARQPKDKPVVFVVHTEEYDQVLAASRGINAKLMLYGHWHASKIVRDGGLLIVATPPMCFGAMDTRPRGYRVVSVDGDSVRVRLRPLAPPCMSGSKANVQIEPIRIEWERRFDTPFHRAAPVCAGDRLLLSICDEDQRGDQGVRCIDPHTGHTRWHFQTDASVKNTVAVRGDRCYAVSITGCVYAISLESGALCWSARLPDRPRRWIYSTPVVDDLRLYAGAQQGFGAFGMDGGKRQWYTPLQSHDAWPSYASPLVYGPNIVQMIGRRGVLALDRGTGNIVWENSFATEYHHPSPVLTGDRIVAIGDPGHLHVLDAATGRTIWHKPVLDSKYAYALAARGGCIVVATDDGHVQCHDPAGGRRRWRYALGPDLLDMTPYAHGARTALAQPLLTDDAIIIAAVDGALHMLDFGGQLRQVARLGMALSATPCLDQGALYVGTYEGVLYKLVV